ncbi:hypothetical protein [Alkalinema sp. FACHB-956]|uniref:hypothetical protein n=1 Tax=Alkalinema sp. FACHB-956 TaxID=2692768 RepID=UPI001682CFB0|nr:hypothetical protein [Alkalinema sp. FACHB-956]MBD2325995.1 hypothetical protein [Alkalinema sp. FACHB-956]
MGSAKQHQGSPWLYLKYRNFCPDVGSPQKIHQGSAAIDRSVPSFWDALNR